MKLEFVHYWDVWGNEKEGFDVNDVSRHGPFECKGLESSKDVLKFLKDAGLIVKSTRVKSFQSIDFQDENTVELTLRNGRPFGRIQEAG